MAPQRPGSNTGVIGVFMKEKCENIPYFWLEAYEPGKANNNQERAMKRDVAYTAIFASFLT